MKRNRRRILALSIVVAIVAQQSLPAVLAADTKSVEAVSEAVSQCNAGEETGIPETLIDGNNAESKENENTGGTQPPEVSSESADMGTGSETGADAVNEGTGNEMDKDTADAGADSETNEDTADTGAGSGTDIDETDAEEDHETELNGIDAGIANGADSNALGSETDYETNIAADSINLAASEDEEGNSGDESDSADENEESGEESEKESEEETEKETDGVEMTSITTKVTWKDSNNANDARPNNLTIYLLRGGRQYTSTQVTASDGWEWTFEVPKYDEGGKELSYTVSVWYDTQSYYDTQVNGYDVTCTYTGMVNKNVYISWMDLETEREQRPENVTITLFANGEKYSSCKLEECTHYSENYSEYTFSNLPMFDVNGEEITYSISAEVEDGSGYSVQIEEYDGGWGWDVILATEKALETVDISVEIIWDDNGNANGYRPTVKCVLSDSNWTFNIEKGDKGYSFKRPKYDGKGNEISYIPCILSLPQYYKATVAAKGEVYKYNITLTYLDPSKTTSVDTKIIWNDNHNAAGERPDSILVGIKPEGSTQEAVGMAKSTSSDQWVYKFSGYQKYDDNNTEITYEAVPYPVKGYSASVSGTTVTYTYIGTTSVSGSIIWQDHDNSAQYRPSFVNVNLLKNGTEMNIYTLASEHSDWNWSFDDLQKYDEKGDEIKYTVSVEEVSYYTNSVDGTKITFKVKEDRTKVNGSFTWVGGPAAEEVEIVLLADGEIYEKKSVSSREWSFTDLPMYKEDGTTPIEYTVSVPDVPENYTIDVDGYDVTFTYTEKPETVAVNGTVSWEDEENAKGVRPDIVYLDVYGSTNSSFPAKTIAVESEGDGVYSVELPRYENGYEVKYTISAQEVPYYQERVSGYDVTLIYTTQVQIYKSVTVEWDDQNNKDKIRPSGITVYAMQGTEQEASAYLRFPSNRSSAFFQNAFILPKYTEGKIAAYSLKCEELDDYVVTVTETNFGWNILLTACFNLSNFIIWEDEDDQDGIRPKNILVSLMNGETVAATQTISEADDWEWNFSGINRYDEDGNEISYTIKIGDVPGYTKTEEDGTVTYTHVPEKVALTAGVIWEDENNRHGIRPETVTICLMNGDTVVEELELGAKDGWKWIFENLPKYEEGKEIQYTLDAQQVSGYNMTIDGLNVVYTYVEEETETESETSPETEAETETETTSALGVATGDSARTGLYLFLLVTSGFTGLAALAFRKRKDN